MKYSIIIPVYNAADYIRDCVGSIFKSGLTDFEIILVNDGSRDNSLQICKELSDAYGQITYYDQKNAGVSVARNRGIDLAKGEYILFCDADDTFTEGCFSDLEAYICDSPDSIIYGLRQDYYFHGQCYTHADVIYPFEGTMEKDAFCKKLTELYRYNVLSPVWNKIYKAEIIKNRSIYFDTGMILFEDFVFSVRYLACCEKVSFMKTVAYRYRQSENERNAQKRLDRIQSVNTMVKGIQDDFLNSFIQIPEYDRTIEDTIYSIVYEIYYMLISQKLYYSGIHQMKSCADLIRESEFQESRYLDRISNTFKQMYFELMNKKYWKILLRNRYHIIRHFFAIRYKYVKKGLKHGY